MPQPIGTHFSITENGQTLEVFDALGSIFEGYFATNLFSATEYGPLTEVNPFDGPYQQIINLLSRLNRANRIGEISRIQMNSICACWLWLRRRLTPENFRTVTETDDVVLTQANFDGFYVVLEIHDARKVEYFWRIVDKNDNVIKP